MLIKEESYEHVHIKKKRKIKNIYGIEEEVEFNTVDGDELDEQGYELNKKVFEESVVPKPIAFPSGEIYPILSLNFHPKEDRIIFGDIDGMIFEYKYHADENLLIRTLDDIHVESVRDLAYSDDGNLLFSVSADKSFIVTDYETGSIHWGNYEAHKNKINKMMICDENLVATGDDNGFVNVWDIRLPEEKARIGSFDEHADYISGMDYNEDTNILYCSSGDGSMSVYDLRRKKAIDITPNTDKDFTGICEIQNGAFVVCSTSKSELIKFEVGKYDGPSSRYKPPTKIPSMDSLLFLKENLVLTSSVDGIVRMFRVDEMKHVCNVGYHGESIVAMAMSSDGRYIATCGEEKEVKFWDIGRHFGKNNLKILQKEDEDENQLTLTETKKDKGNTVGKKRKISEVSKKVVVDDELSDYSDLSDHTDEEDSEEDFEDVDSDDIDEDMDDDKKVHKDVSVSIVESSTTNTNMKVEESKKEPESNTFTYEASSISIENNPFAQTNKDSIENDKISLVIKKDKVQKKDEETEEKKKKKKKRKGAHVNERNAFFSDLFKYQ